MRFDADRFGGLALGLEGGHSVRRVVHAGGSATGRRVVRQLSALAAAEPRITVLEGAQARALWRADGRCRGLVCDGRVVLARRAVLLATGGAAALWERTTNPPGSQGFGLLLAHAAGAALADLELLQFHPTAVIGVPGREGFLVTEAIRGEGATLHDAAGERFVDELAPRDEVARAIQELLDRTGARSVGLDMRGIDPASFPNVVAALREAGVDPATELVPGGAGRPLHDGRHRHRPRRALDDPRPVRRRRGLVHGPARCEPARLELAQRVLRVRRAGGRERAVGAGERACDAERGRAAGAGLGARADERGRGDARSAVARRRHRPDRREPRAARHRSPPAREADRPLRAGAHREPRSAPAHRPPRREPEFDLRHAVVAGEDGLDWQTWR